MFIRLCLIVIFVFAASLPVQAQEQARDPGAFYSWVHGFAPETAMGFWRGSRDFQKTLQSRGFEIGQPVYIRIFKNEQVLEVWLKRAERFELFEIYPMCKFSGLLGPKQKEGDQQAPEGFYPVGLQQLNPGSRYHLALNMGYPNAYDKDNGRTGAHLMIHGACASIGCYALTNGNIDEVYGLVAAALANGQASVPVHAFPFRMTLEALRAHKDSAWIDFWMNELLPAYDAFDITGLPPQMMSCNGTYAIMDGLAPDDIPANCTPITPWGDPTAEKASKQPKSAVKPSPKPSAK